MRMFTRLISVLVVIGSIYNAKSTSHSNWTRLSTTGDFSARCSFGATIENDTLLVIVRSLFRIHSHISQLNLTCILHTYSIPLSLVIHSQKFTNLTHEGLSALLRNARITIFRFFAFTLTNIYSLSLSLKEF